MRRTSKRLAPWAVVAWVALWQVASMAWDSPLLLPGPLDVGTHLAALVPDPAFWRRVLFSLARIAAGFAAGAVAGGIGALAAARWCAAEDLLAPPMALAKSVPVASITVLALVWLRAANLAVLVVMLVVMPLVYESMLSGLRSTDRALDEAAALFGIGGGRRLRFLIMPRLYPHLEAALGTALGMAWKAGVAAEVIGIPAGSLGEAVYDAKVYFDTAGLFAVTIAVVAASSLTTWLVRSALRALEPVACGGAGHARRFESVDGWSAGSVTASMGGTGAQVGLVLEGISKSYGVRPVLEDVAFSVRPGTPVCLMAPSGSGKTTLLRIVAGLERADRGTVTMDDKPRWLPRISMAFQDDRLADQASALANARLPLEPGSAAWNRAPELLRALGIGERMHSPAGTCSGGERKRIVLARALLAPHDILLLDEPFSGLDYAARAEAAAVVREREGSSVVIAATHDRRDAELLGARIVTLPAAGQAHEEPADSEPSVAEQPA